MKYFKKIPGIPAIIFRDGSVARISDGHFFAPALERRNNTLYVSIWFDVPGKPHKQRVSKVVKRLVADAFIPNPDNLKNILHKDGDPRNCHYKNLYRTNKQRKSGNRIGVRGEDRKKQAKLTNEMVAFILISKIKTVKLAKILGVSYPLVSAIRSGKRWQHISSLPQEAIETLAKKADVQFTQEQKDGIEALELSRNIYTKKGVEKILQARERERRKVPVQIDARTTIMVYPEKVREVKKKYGLLN